MVSATGNNLVITVIAIIVIAGTINAQVLPNIPVPHHYENLADMEDDMGHLKEDLKDEQELDLTPEEIEKLTPNERRFYYFALHDYDKNKRLDGQELMKAIYHSMDHEHKRSENQSEGDTLPNMETYQDVIEKMMEVNDIDKDGYMSYAEFILGIESQANQANQEQGNQQPTA